MCTEQLFEGELKEMIPVECPSIMLRIRKAVSSPLHS